MPVNLFQGKKKAVQRLPFRRDFSAHVRTAADRAEALREGLQLVVEGKGECAVAAVPAPLADWGQLAMPSAVRAALKAAAHTSPTPIQAQLIPALLAGLDCLGIAQTGSGKTLAYLLPLLTHVLAQSCEICRNPIALILAPTRELALQINHVLRPLAHGVGLSVVRVIGGTDRMSMDTTLGVCSHICVATPNCFFDTAIVDGITLSCHRLTFVVLDEVDKMLAMGFEEQARAILKGVRVDRQLALLSATCSAPVQRLLRSLVPNFVKVAVAEVAGLTLNAAIQQRFHIVRDLNQRVSLLVELLQGQAPGSVVVFVDTHRRAVNLTDSLCRKGIPSVALHGKLPQHERTTAMRRFEGGGAHVLVATDIAARGLDLRPVRLVANYVMPRKARDYVHRIGRTGRAGDEGISHSLLVPEDAQVCRGICVALREAGLPVPEELRTIAKATPPDDEEAGLTASEVQLRWERRRWKRTRHAEE